MALKEITGFIMSLKYRPSSPSIDFYQQTVTGYHPDENIVPRTSFTEYLLYNLEYNSYFIPTQ